VNILALYVASGGAPENLHAKLEKAYRDDWNGELPDVAPECSPVITCLFPGSLAFKDFLMF
jgi:hypothetical protein